MPQKKSSNPAKAASKSSTSNSPASTQDLKPFEVLLLIEIHKRAVMTIEEVQHFARTQRPAPSNSKLAKALNSLQERRFLHKFEELDAYIINNVVVTPSLKLISNPQVETALRAFGKYHFDAEMAKDCGNTALYVLLIALQHPHSLSRWINDMVRYTKSEALDQLHYLSKDVKAKCEAFERELHARGYKIK
jgi:hypothetical protein